LSIYILTAGARGQLKNEPLGAVVLWILRPLQMVSQGTVNWIKNFADNYNTLSAFKSENARLRKRIETLEVEKQKLMEADATYRRLQQLLDFRARVPGRAITASILPIAPPVGFRVVCSIKAAPRSSQRNGRVDPWASSAKWWR
jgi:hypothetical protein